MLPVRLYRPAGRLRANRQRKTRPHRLPTRPAAAWKMTATAARCRSLLPQRFRTKCSRFAVVLSVHHRQWHDAPTETSARALIMSMSTPPVGPQPASNNGNTDDPKQTAEAQKGAPAAATEAPVTIAGLPKRTPFATGAQDPDRRYPFRSKPPSLDGTSAPTDVPDEDGPPPKRLLNLNALFKRTPPESPAEDATPSDPAQT